MKQTINQSQFREAFLDCGREDQFSRAALEVLFDFFEEIDPNMEIDPIAICCEWTEYESAQDAAFDCGGEFDSEQEDEALEWLTDRTVVLDAITSIVIANF